MAWVYLIAAGLFEVGWPIGLKWAQDPRKLIIGVVMAIGCLIVSGVLLYLAQREIALGTAYGAKSTTLAVTTSTRARGLATARRRRYSPTGAHPTAGRPSSPQRQTTHPSASGGCSLSPVYAHLKSVPC